MESYTVTELSDNIKNLINKEFKNHYITVTGEISNLKHSGKHTYFTLKDDTTQISVVFFGVNVDNKQGDKVEVIGRLEFYTKNGHINFVGTSIKIMGIGSLHTEYEKIRTEYEKKGYFNNRKQLPKSVKKIGVVTSENGAALQDFLYVLRKNNFIGDVCIYDCSVQGNNCPNTVASGIKFFNNAFYPMFEEDNEQEPFDENDKYIIHKTKKNTYDDSDDEIEVDIIIVTRGGGSFEELMGFSHPKVIEAIYASKKYIISAVGHEVDNMLSDFVANYRAPTPSVAGEVICSINQNKIKQISLLENSLLNIKHDMLQTLYKYKKGLMQIQASIEDPTELLNSKLNSLALLSKQHLRLKLSSYSVILNRIKNVVESNNVDEMLKHGFILLTNNDGNIVTSISDILNKELKMIHPSGRYNIIIKEVS
jgi:exodeoxyribonuclease VII large subunit